MQQSDLTRRVLMMPWWLATLRRWSPTNKQLAALLQWLAHHVLAREHHHVEHVVLAGADTEP